MKALFRRMSLLEESMRKASEAIKALEDK